jgi:formate dehydrogenase subunit gamma
MQYNDFARGDDDNGLAMACSHGSDAARGIPIENEGHQKAPARSGGTKLEEQVRLMRNVLDRHAGTEGAALPVLHDIQEALGFIPAEAVPLVAAALNRTRAEIHGVLTFYHDFRTAPPARHVVRLCQAEACQSMGAAAVATAMAGRIGVSMGETSADGRVALEAVYCLGLCACAPAGMVDGEVVGRIDAAAVEMIGEALAQ